MMPLCDMQGEGVEGAVGYRSDILDCEHVLSDESPFSSPVHAKKEPAPEGVLIADITKDDDSLESEVEAQEMLRTESSHASSQPKPISPF